MTPNRSVRSTLLYRSFWVLRFDLKGDLPSQKAIRDGSGGEFVVGDIFVSTMGEKVQDSVTRRNK